MEMPVTNAIVEYLDYQILVTQLRGTKLDYQIPVTQLKRRKGNGDMQAESEIEMRHLRYASSKARLKCATYPD